MCYCGIPIMSAIIPKRPAERHLVAAAALSLIDEARSRGLEDAEIIATLDGADRHQYRRCLPPFRSRADKGGHSWWRRAAQPGHGRNAGRAVGAGSRIDARRHWHG